MKRLLSILFFLSLTPFLFGQSIEFLGGFTSTKLSSNSSNNPHDYLNYKRSHAPHFSLGVNQLSFPLGNKNLTLDLLINYDSYAGPISSGKGGLGISNSTDAFVERSTIGMALYPLHLHLFKKRVRLSLGAEYARTLDQHISGEKRYRLGSMIRNSLIDPTNTNFYVDDRFSLNLKFHLKIIEIKQVSLNFLFNYSIGRSQEFLGLEHPAFGYFKRTALSLAWKR